MENYYGMLFNTLNRNQGLNGSLPKINDRIICRSQETRDKQRINLKEQLIKLGKPLNSRIVSSYDLFGNYLKTFNTIKEAAMHYGVRQSMIGKVLNPKYSRYCHNMQFKYGNSIENIGEIKLWSKYKKVIGKFSLDDKLLETMPSISYFVNKYNYPRSSIYKCLNGTMKSCAGYKWKFIEQ